MDKRTTQEQVRSVSTDDEGSENSPQTHAPYWQPGYLKRFPTLGFGSILLVLVCTLASVVVLVVSDRKSASQWTQRLAPNVVLSGLNALSNLALMIAVTRGVAIAWWRRAMHGATVAQLHDCWGQSSSSYELFRNFFRLDTIGVAALATKLALVDSILFQRATTVYVGQDPIKNITMMGVAATQFPQTGFVVSEGFGAQSNCECFMIGDAYTPVVNNWESSNGFFKGFNKFFQACDGTCFTSIEAIGFEISCTRQQTHTNVAENAIATYKSSKGNAANASAWSNLPIFNSSFGVTFANASRNYPTIDMSLLYFQSDDPNNPSAETCPGNVFTIQCELRPALVTYPLTVTNYTNEHITNGVSLGIFGTGATPDVDEVINAPEPLSKYSFEHKQAEGYKVGAYLYPLETPTLNSSTYLGGIANALSQFLSSSAAITYQGNDLWGLKQVGTLAQTMMYGPPNMGSCDCSFKHDALDTLINAINQLTFLTSTGMIDSTTWSFPKDSRNAVFSSVSSNKQPTLTVNTSTAVTVSGIGGNFTTHFRDLLGSQEIRDVVHYRTDYLYMGLAVGFTLCCVFLVLPVYWKYGELGRDVTLGPIEIAGAFQAPLLSTKGAPSPQPQGAEKLSGVPASPTSPTTPHAPAIAFANVEELLEEVGDRKVTYGFVDVHEPVEEEVVPGSPLLSSTSGTIKRRSVLAFLDSQHPEMRRANTVNQNTTSSSRV